MFSYIWNAFISGILFYWYLIINNWWWIFGLTMFVIISFIETNQIEEQYVDDQRAIL